MLGMVYRWGHHKSYKMGSENRNPRAVPKEYIWKRDVGKVGLDNDRQIFFSSSKNIFNKSRERNSFFSKPRNHLLPLNSSTFAQKVWSWDASSSEDAIVTTRVITFLLRDPYEPLCPILPTVGRGASQYQISKIMEKIKMWNSPSGHFWLGSFFKTSSEISIITTITTPPPIFYPFTNFLGHPIASRDAEFPQPIPLILWLPGELSSWSQCRIFGPFLVQGKRMIWSVSSNTILGTSEMIALFPNSSFEFSGILHVTH